LPAGHLYRAAGFRSHSGGSGSTASGSATSANSILPRPINQTRPYRFGSLAAGGHCTGMPTGMPLFMTSHLLGEQPSTRPVQRCQIVEGTDQQTSTTMEINERAVRIQ
jgi:hypothetical protein